MTQNSLDIYKSSIKTITILGKDHVTGLLAVLKVEKYASLYSGKYVFLNLDLFWDQCFTFI